MQRLFTEHKIRKVEILDGTWLFRVDPKNEGMNNGWEMAIPAPKKCVVPSVWNTDVRFADYEGAAWYSREIYTDGGDLRFAFGAVMTEAKVWLDGEYLGSHYGGFCEFDLIARGVCPGAHTLTVRVDNSFDAHSIPQSGVDWYHYGGITRQVSVEQLKGISVLSARLEYTLDSSLKSARARVVAELYNAADADITDELKVTLLENEITLPVSVKAGERSEICTQYFAISGFNLWSAESPVLYEMNITTSTDDLCDRVGFRLVEVKPDGIYVNRKRVELLGVNRHDEHPDFGFAFPPSLMKRDIDIARGMGCNTLRGAHYPNNPLFVDMLDEEGIYFYSEIPIWGGGFSREALADSLVLSRGEEMHRDMVKHYYNHPSIIIWGMHNEILTETDEGVEMSRRYYNLLSEIGGNRAVTYATNRPLTDRALEYCDFISINMYIGWYGSKNDTWEDFLDKVRERRKALGLEMKPVMMTEFGAAAVFGHRSFETTRWSEEYQARLLADCITLFHSDPMIVGTYVWHFADARTQFDLTRARGYNNKGVLNEYRQPKAAYFAVGKLYKEYQNK